MNVTITAHEAARTGDLDLHGLKFYADDGAHSFREGYVTLRTARVIAHELASLTGLDAMMRAIVAALPADFKADLHLDDTLIGQRFSGLPRRDVSPYRAPILLIPGFSALILLPQTRRYSARRRTMSKSVIDRLQSGLLSKSVSKTVGIAPTSLERIGWTPRSQHWRNTGEQAHDLDSTCAAGISCATLLTPGRKCR
jgi:hypothetical protein